MYLSSPGEGSGSIALEIPEGDQGTEQTIAWMRRLIDQGLRDVDVNRLAVALVSGTPAHDTEAEARAIYDWVRRNIRFTGDIVTAETLRPVQEILRIRAGDCDDINGVLLPTLLMSVGIETRLITVAADSSRPDTFSHIYPQALINGAWTPVDAAAQHASFGREPATVYRKRVWDLETGHHQDLQGLGQDDEGDGSGIDWTSLTQAIVAGTTGAANIILATKAPVSATIAAMPMATVQAVAPVASATVTPSAGGSTTVILVGGLALLLLGAVALMKQ